MRATLLLGFVSAFTFCKTNTKLCGSNLKEETTVIRWASFTNYELLPPIMAWIQPIIGRAPTSPEILKEREEGCELTIRAIEKEIKGKKYLVNLGRPFRGFRSC